MKMDKFHCFGSRWFCLQMQQAFDRQSNFFGEILQTGQSEKFRQVLLLCQWSVKRFVQNAQA
jgi:hypothetical protein